MRVRLVRSSGRRREAFYCGLTAEDHDLVICCIGDHVVYRRGCSVKFSTQIVASLLLRMMACPGLHSDDELAEVCWGGRADGGPERALNTLYQYIREVRIAGAVLGFSVECAKGRGWALVPSAPRVVDVPEGAPSETLAAE